MQRQTVNKTVGSMSSSSESSDEDSARKLLHDIYQAESGKLKSKVYEMLLFGPVSAYEKAKKKIAREQMDLKIKEIKAIST